MTVALGGVLVSTSEGRAQAKVEEDADASILPDACAVRTTFDSMPFSVTTQEPLCRELQLSLATSTWHLTDGVFHVRSRSQILACSSPHLINLEFST